MHKDPILTEAEKNKSNFLRLARARAIEAYEYAKDNMDRAEEDLDWIFGEQYKDSERDIDNRLELTFNKLPQFINKVTGGQRSSVQSIKVSPTGVSFGKEEPRLTAESGKEIPLSTVLTALIRDIQYQCNAQDWYKTAFKHALEGGFGWLRVYTKYQDKGFDQDIVISGVRNRWAVVIDPKAQESDRSDMNYAFISERMDLEEFKTRYPNKSYEQVLQDGELVNTFWGEQDTITVTEYFRRVATERTLVELSSGEIHYKDEIEDVLDKLDEKIIRERKVTTYKVLWSKISALDILEKEREIKTSTIPIVPVLGRVTDFKVKKETKGLIHDAIDAQKAVNIMKSSALERIDQAPLSPWLASDKAIKGYENEWKYANTMKYDTLTYNEGYTPPTRLANAPMPVAELQTADTMANDMKDSTGIFNASLGQSSSEISGKAIKARQSEADVGTYEFIDNYKNAIRRVGILCTELIPHIYDTERTLRLRHADDTTDVIVVNKVVRDEQTGKDIVVHDLNQGTHTVVISTGATYENKREENAEQILELIRINPKVAEVGSDLLVKNLDFSDSDILAERLEKTIPLQFLPKEKQEEIQKDMPASQPSPEQIKAEAEQKKIETETQIKEMELDYKLRTAEINLQIEQTRLELERIRIGKNVSDNKEQIAKNIADKIKQNKV